MYIHVCMFPFQHCVIPYTGICIHVLPHPVCLLFVPDVALVRLSVLELVLGWRLRALTNRAGGGRVGEREEEVDEWVDVLFGVDSAPVTTSASFSSFFTSESSGGDDSSSVCGGCCFSSSATSIWAGWV